MIVGFTGKKQSGKSTASKYVAHKYNLRRVNFKDALVHEIKDRFPDLLKSIIEVMERVDFNDLNPWTIDRLFQDKPPLMRSLLQNHGTNVRRMDNGNYWVNQWKAETIGKDVVVDDVRFLNEAEAIRERGGVIIRITRLGLSSSDNHISEIEMDQITPDFTITVDTGDFATLYRQLEEIVSSITHGTP